MEAYVVAKALLLSSEYLTPLSLHFFMESVTVKSQKKLDNFCFIKKILWTLCFDMNISLFP